MNLDYLSLDLFYLVKAILSDSRHWFLSLCYSWYRVQLALAIAFMVLLSMVFLIENFSNMKLEGNLINIDTKWNTDHWLSCYSTWGFYLCFVSQCKAEYICDDGFYIFWWVYGNSSVILNARHFDLSFNSLDGKTHLMSWPEEEKKPNLS